MSPRTSENARRTAAIADLVCRDVGRKTADLIAASAGGLDDATQALCGARSVGLITGFFVPRDAGPVFGEGDGVVADFVPGDGHGGVSFVLWHPRGKEYFTPWAFQSASAASCALFFNVST